MTSTQSKESDSRRVRMTKRILKDTLLELLQEKEIHQVSIRELCNAADMNRSTFYKHYGSQYDLLMDMENDIFEQLNHMFEFPEDSDSIPAICSSPLSRVLNFFLKNLELCRLLCNSNVDPDFPRKIFTLPSIQNAIYSALPSKDSYYSECISTFIIYGSYQILVRWLNDDERVSCDEMAQIIKQLCLSCVEHA